MSWRGATPGTAAPLAQALLACDDDLGVSLHEAVGRVGPRALGVIELPALGVGGRLSRGEVLAVACLLWLRDVERAGLPRFTESLVQRLMEGRILLPLDGPTMGAVGRYHKARGERHIAQERAWLYSHVLGGPGAPEPNEAFAPAWSALLDCLEADVGGGPHAGARVAVAAQELMSALAPRAGGALRYHADRILAHVRESLALLQSPGLRRALGDASPPQLLRWYGAEVLGESLRPETALASAQASSDLMRWVAHQLDALQSGELGRGVLAEAREHASRLRAEAS